MWSASVSYTLLANILGADAMIVSNDEGETAKEWGMEVDGLFLLNAMFYLFVCL